MNKIILYSCYLGLLILIASAETMYFSAVIECSSVAGCWKSSMSIGSNSCQMGENFFPDNLANQQWWTCGDMAVWLSRQNLSQHMYGDIDVYVQIRHGSNVYETVNSISGGPSDCEHDHTPCWYERMIVVYAPFVCNNGCRGATPHINNTVIKSIHG